MNDDYYYTVDYCAYMTDDQDEKIVKVVAGAAVDRSSSAKSDP